MDDAPGLNNFLDLASAMHGGAVVAVNDEFFAFAERMLLPEPPVARPGVFTERGQWTDGWETRRRRDFPGQDWAIIRLGMPGIVHAVTIDTTHFTGNSPESVELYGCTVAGYPSPDELTEASVQWMPLVPRTPVKADTVNLLPVDRTGRVRVTHLRLLIHPDGGVARLRVHGTVLPDPRLLDRVTSDLAAAYNGGVVVAASDMHYGDRHNLNASGEARVMGEGWETRRRRGGGHDWAVVRLATAGTLVRAEVDTRHFRGNAPQAVELWAAHEPDLTDAAITNAVDVTTVARWWPLLPRTRVQPNTRHLFDLSDPAPATHVRIDAIPDGGLARLRLVGRPTPSGRETLAMRWFDMLPACAAVDELLACCASSDWARAVAAGRPYGTLTTLLSAAEQAWRDLPESAWLEAFAAHPRIGGLLGDAVSPNPPRRPWAAASTQAIAPRVARDPASLEASRWEQHAMERAGEDVQTAIADGNAAYQKRFGYIFLVRAAGRSAEEMLSLLRQRMANDPATELQVAAGQQAEITTLRLRRLILGI